MMKKSARKLEWMNLCTNDNFEKRQPTFISDPGCSPLDFENFVPWVCRKWSISTSVLVTRKSQEYIGKKVIKPQQSKSKLDLVGQLSRKLIDVVIESERQYLVPITTYYDSKDRLVEISIVGSTVTVCRNIIAAISLSIPYHSSLTRFTYRKTCLTAALIYEINKLLPISNISEIIFDDTDVPDANYYILLQQPSQLRYLSLNRCNVNDEVCKKIFENLKFDSPAAQTLQLLNLGSNDITDDAAIYIGSVLRVNRSLLHLNLSGNKITDSGFVPILDSLMEFPLSVEEKCDAGHRRIRYLQSKVAVYEKCLSNLRRKRIEEFNSSIMSRKKKSMLVRASVSSAKYRKSLVNLEDEAEIMSRNILGEFQDPFSPVDVVVKNDTTHSTGNFTLCYINIAYNNLEYKSLEKLHNVLQYQDSIRLKSQSAVVVTGGLIKVTLDGNYIPSACPLLKEIDLLLSKVISLRSRLFSKKSMYTRSTPFTAVASV